MKELCVVHLVRAQNGIEPFSRFLESYRQCPGGIEHDLLIVFKGFDQQQDTAEYLELLAPVRYLTLNISDEGFDITAYFAAARRYSEHYLYFCFLNSFSVIQERDWLRKLHENMSKPGVGLVGATGSWQSLRATLLSRRQAGAIAEGLNRARKNRVFFKLLISAIKSILRQNRFVFNEFPNYHMRTNAFMISGDLMLKIETPSMQTKMDAYKFESGRKGFTKQILDMGKRAIVVGKDGAGYDKERWNESRTFWQSDQENLLVADNQTRDYQEGSPERRRILSTEAWGELG